MSVCTPGFEPGKSGSLGRLGRPLRHAHANSDTKLLPSKEWPQSRAMPVLLTANTQQSDKGRWQRHTVADSLTQIQGLSRQYSRGCQYLGTTACIPVIRGAWSSQFTLHRCCTGTRRHTKNIPKEDIHVVLVETAVPFPSVMRFNPRMSLLQEVVAFQYVSIRCLSLSVKDFGVATAAIPAALVDREQGLCGVSFPPIDTQSNPCQQRTRSDLPIMMTSESLKSLK